MPRATRFVVCAAFFLLMPAPFAAAQNDPHPSTIETVTVTAPRWREQALKAKEAAPNVVEIQPVQEIRKLPDVNVAEALQRLPGISMEADSGEGRFVNIRGMDADLNGTTFDGVTLMPSNQASPQGGARAVAFDAFPSGVIGGVEIIKSLTPDMDAEGLGGVVNILPRGLPAGGASFLDAGVGSGYEPLRDRPLWQGDVTGGTSLDESGDIGDGGPFSLVGTYGYEEDHRGINDIEEDYSLDPEPYNNPQLAKIFSDVQYRWYEYHRIRQGAAGNFSWSPNPTNEFFLRVLHAGYTEYAEKHELVLQNLDGCLNDTPPDCYISRGAGFNAPYAIPLQNFTDSAEHVGNDLIEFGGHSRFGTLLVDYRGAWNRGHDDFPTNWGGGFATTSFVPLTYNNLISASHPTWNSPVNLANSALYAFGLDAANPDDPINTSYLQNAPSISHDEEWSGAVDVTLPLDAEDLPGRLKFGSQIRLRSRLDTMDQMTFEPLSPVSLTGLTVGPNIIYYDNMYNIGPNLNAHAIETLPGLYLVDPGSPGNFDANSDYATNQQAYQNDSENVFAGYAMYTTDFGPWGVIGGVRVESTDGTYRAFSLITQPDGSLELVPNVNRQNYTDVFPSLQGKYRLDDDTLLRLAFSTAIARPGFNQITAAKTIDYVSCAPDICISEGNPGLKPTTGDSLDATVQHSLPNGGVIYGGLFYKYFQNYIVPTVDITPNGNGSNTITSGFSNIGRALTQGAEAAYTQYFTFLPQPFDGLGIDGNLTFNYARGDIRPNGWKQLPQTSPWNYNLELLYEKAPVSLRLAASYVSTNLWVVGPDPTQDQYSQARFRLDFGSTYDITGNVQAYFNIKNLTNTILEFTQSRSQYYPVQREFYGPTYFFGLRVALGPEGFASLNREDDD
ncbi:MAG TPA: TonB-dependent receptor [Rhizomicrobium sp.]|nr:TonB-dependent receptor [Rhizomicrobium sp.]